MLVPSCLCHRFWSSTGIPLGFLLPEAFGRSCTISDLSRGTSRDDEVKKIRGLEMRSVVCNLGRDEWV